MLIFACDHAGRWDFIFGLGIAFFYVYQIIDAVRTAHAIQAGLPAPDPYGLAQTFSMGAPSERGESKSIPAVAVILIGLGVLFLHARDAVTHVTSDGVRDAIDLLNETAELFAGHRESLFCGTYRRQRRCSSANQGNSDPWHLLSMMLVSTRSMSSTAARPMRRARWRRRNRRGRRP